jgi:hypothetical protein
MSDVQSLMDLTGRWDVFCLPFREFKIRGSGNHPRQARRPKTQSCRLLAATACCQSPNTAMFIRRYLYAKMSGAACLLPSNVNLYLGDSPDIEGVSHAGRTVGGGSTTSPVLNLPMQPRFPLGVFLNPLGHQDV